MKSRRLIGSPAVDAWAHFGPSFATQVDREAMLDVARGARASAPLPDLVRRPNIPQYLGLRQTKDCWTLRDDPAVTAARSEGLAAGLQLQPAGPLRRCPPAFDRTLKSAALPPLPIHSGSLNMRRHRGSAVDSYVGACPLSASRIPLRRDMRWRERPLAFARRRWHEHTRTFALLDQKPCRPRRPRRCAGATCSR
jgi:hypothetical protein